MVFIDPCALDEMAYNFHYHGDFTIKLEDLEKRGWATKEHILAIMNQVSCYISMWEETLADMENLLHDAHNELEEKEMSE